MCHFVYHISYFNNQIKLYMYTCIILVHLECIYYNAYFFFKKSLIYFFEKKSYVHESNNI
jgi:hypothetical protein